MQNLALYRKYRPNTFSDVCGQEQVTDTLRRQVSLSRHSHAYLFIGTRGTGKTTCAKILAKAINCENNIDGNPCNKCSACVAIDTNSTMDIVEIDAASNSGVDNIRNLREEAVFSPSMLRRRVYIIDEVHMLSNAAFNALLKIMEEPPEHLVFILATTELRKVPATILSRCQRYTFRRLSSDVIANRLRYVTACEKIEISDEAIRFISRIADGALRDALSLLDQCSTGEYIDSDMIASIIGITDTVQSLDIMRAVAANDAFSALCLFSELWNTGRDPAKVLAELCSLCRDLLVMSVAGERAEALLSGAYDNEDLRDLLQYFSDEKLISCLEYMQKTIASLRENPSPNTAVELCLVSLCAGTSTVTERKIIEKPKAKPKTEGKKPEPKPEPRPESKPEPMIEKIPEPIPEPLPQKSEHADTWTEFLDMARNFGEPGIVNILSDNLHVDGSFSENSLNIIALNDFAYSMIKSADKMREIEKIATRFRGVETAVSINRGTSDKSAMTRSIEELKQFKQVKFI